MTTAPASCETIPDRVKHWAELYPDKEVFIFYSDAGRRALTCKDVYTYSMKFAALLQRRGLKHGDVVCNTLTNSPERIVTDFGIMAAGCIAANAQALLTDGNDLLHVINLSRCRLLVTDNTLPGGAWDILKGHLGDVVDLKINCSKTPNLQMVQYAGVFEDTGFLQTLLNECDPKPVSISAADTALYRTTSGSTGFSKLVPHKHKIMIKMSFDVARLFRVKENDTVYSDRPLGWGGGWPYLFVHFGLIQVLTDSRGPVADQCKLTWHAVNAEKCTFAILTIAFMRKLLERSDILDPQCTLLDKVVATGQPFRKHCYDIIGKISRTVVSAYGLSEAGYVSSCFCENEEDFVDNIAGRTVGHLEIKIVNDRFQEVAQGENGQILIKGPSMLEEYVSNPEATKAAFTEDGWLKTNDIGMLDENGQLLIEGRHSDAIMHGEYIIHPAWVERKLRMCPYVGEVMVIGIPDEKMHHLICACVIPKSGKSVTCDMLREFCDPMFTVNTLQEMTAKPDFYVVVEGFPTRPSGKPDRRALSELATNLISSQDKV